MATAAKDDALNKALKTHLKEVEKHVIFDHEEAKVNVRIMEATMNALVYAMKESSPLFGQLFQRPVYTGSYYERLRIKSANEFDLNIVIRLPFDASDVEVSIVPSAPEYVTYHLKRSVEEIHSHHPKWDGPDLYKKLCDFFDKDRYLLRCKLHRWVQSIISIAMNTGKFKLPPGVAKIEPSQSGPAFTYYIYTTAGKKIDVDLVPAVDGRPYDSVFKHLTKSDRFKKILSEKSVARTWFMVPKPPKGPADAKAERHWRTAFPEAEKKLLDDTGCLKLLVKLFKFLRDCEDWKPIASYYIKTMFILEFEKNPSLKVWSEANLGTLFMKMLHVFQKAVSSQQIHYYFHHGANLLKNLSPKTASNYSDRLKAIIASIEKDPSSLQKIMSPSRLKS